MRILALIVLVPLSLWGLSATADAQTTYDLVYSDSATRDPSSSLDSAVVSGDIHVFVTPDTGISSVAFYLNDSTQSGDPQQSESVGPYDFAGTEASGDAKPYDTTTLADGFHTITAVVTPTSGSDVTLEATFAVENVGPALGFLPNSVSFTVSGAVSASTDLDLLATDSSAADFTTSVSAGDDWLTVTEDVTTTPAVVTLNVDSTGLAAGNYTATVTATATGLSDATVDVTLEVFDSSVTYSLLISPGADRVGAVPLVDDDIVAGDIYVFTDPDDAVLAVGFYFDNTAGTGTPDHQEGAAPFDLGGTEANGDSKAFDTTTLTDGEHTLTAALDLVGGTTDLVTRTIRVSNLPPALTFGQATASFVLEPAATETLALTLSTTDGVAADFELQTSDGTWLTATCVGCDPADTGTTDASVTVNIDTLTLAPGSYTAVLSAVDLGGTLVDAELEVSLIVSGEGAFALFASDLADRSGGVDLNDGTLSGVTYIYVTPDTGITGIAFYVDDPTRSGAPEHTEGSAPWDLAGGSVATANPTDTTTWVDGFHTLTATLTLVGGTEQVIEAHFLVSNGPPALVFNPSSVSLAMEASATTSLSVALKTNTAELISVVLSAPAPWLVASAAGDTPTTVDLDLDSATLVPGTYSASVIASSDGFLNGTLDVTLVVFTSADHDILVSTSSDRSSAIKLNKKNVIDDVFVFVSPASGIDTVTFFIDDPAGTGTPHRVEESAPFDLSGGSATTANALDTTTYGDGLHSVTAVLDLVGGGTETVIASFNIANGTPGLIFTPGELLILADENGEGAGQGLVGTTDDSSTAYTLTEDASWLSFVQSSPNTGLAVLFEVDTTGLGPGTHSTSVTATADGYLAAELVVTVRLSGSDVYDIVYSTSQDLSSPANLSGAAVVGDIYVILTPETDVESVDFYLDDPGTTGDPHQVENNPPYAFNGGPPTATAPFDTNELGDGAHSITAVVHLVDGGEEIISAVFTIQNGLAVLEFDVPSVLIAVAEGKTDTRSVNLSTSDLSNAEFTLTEQVDWLTVTPASGTSPMKIDLEVSALDLAPGSYDATIEATAVGFGSATLDVRMSVQTDSIYDLLVSVESTRGAPGLLDGAEVSGTIYVFTSPDTDLSSVKFYIDNLLAAGPPFKTENNAPFDLAGGSVLAANPYFTTSVVDGLHTVTAVLELTSGTTEVISATFLVTNQAPTLTVSPPQLNYMSVEGGVPPPTQNLGINTNDGSTATYTITAEDGWVGLTTSTGDTPVTITVAVDPTGLGVGAHQSALQITAPGFSPVEVPVVLTIGQDLCNPLQCSELLIDPPYELTFDVDHGAVEAGIGLDTTGTGFTMILPSAFGSGYLPENLNVDPVAGVLEITTTAGAFSSGTNTQDNALGVGIDVPSQVSLISTTLVDVPVMSGEFEQAGLWFGIDDRNVIKLFVNSAPLGDRVRFLLEVNDVQSTVTFSTPYQDLSSADIQLVLRVNPVDQTITAQYSIDGESLLPLGTHEPPPEFFSFDAAGINPEIGTRSFSGVFASHRNALDFQVFRFSDFSVLSEPLPPPQTEIAFERVSFPQVVEKPTAMVWGPDGKLYVVELLGRIHAFELGPNKLPISHQVINTFTTAYGARLTLGITIDPLSTADDVSLWLAHSSPDQNSGDINSGTVTRLSGPSFATIDDVIVFLPRAFANHAPNHLHFGPDERLYFTIGGNTGAGAPNNSASEFGTRPEQYLSAALLVCDVLALAWPIDCDDGLLNDDPLNEPAIPPCADGLDPEVIVFSSGLRNMYDFTFHPNGHIFGADNGLGVTGTYPPDPTAPCFGPANVLTNDPGTQSDILLLLREGDYFGHPNPARDECVDRDGSAQGVDPLDNYTGPLLDLGEHKSANGIITYASATAFCGALEGDLLITNFSVGDDLVRVQLSPDGLSALSSPFSLVGEFNDPLPIAQDDDGTIFIGEFNGDRVTVLIPKDTGCWSDGADLPEALLDVAGAAIDGKFYLVAGKTSTGPVNSIHIYDPLLDSWTSGTDRPGDGVENPAVAADGGLLYVFGGSTLPFSGMLGDAHAYDPATDIWSPLTAMPTPRAGATAQVLDGLIYVMGGLDVDGASLTTVEVYDPFSDSWTTGPSMTTRRDNPGSAVLDGKVFVFGGRIRNSNGSVIDGTLNAVEMFDPALDAWTTQAPMPTGRRTMAVVTLDGSALVIGGESTIDGRAFPQNEAYDPAFNTWKTLAPMLTPRHGCAGVTIDGEVFVAGGGIVSGSSFSSVLEIFAFTTN